jgi:hypothetical protein
MLLSNAQNTSSAAGSIPPLLPQYKFDDYSRTKHWEREEYLVDRKSGKKGEVSDESILSRFMEDGRGDPIPEPTRKAARLMARGYFEYLLQQRQEPACWTAIALNHKHELFNLLESNFEWLRYCEGHWKVDKLCQNVYSPWHSALEKQRDKAANAATPAAEGHKVR